MYLTLSHQRGITKTITAILVIVIVIIAGVGAYFYYVSTLPQKTTTSALSGSITVTAEAGYSDTAVRQIADNFMALYPNTHITVDPISYGNTVADYVTAFSSNQDVYDVVYFPPIGFMGPILPYLLNLEPYVNNPSYFPSSFNISDIMPSAMAPYEINGTLVAIPHAADAMLFYYRPSYFNNVTNQQLFQQEYGYALPNPATATLTLQQLVDVANFFNGAHGSKYGIAIMSGSLDDDMMDTMEALFAGPRVAASSIYGPVTAPYGELFSSNGQLLTNTSIFQSTVSVLTQLIKDSPDPLTASFTMVPGLFESGDAPMMLYWTAAISGLASSPIANDWAIAPSLPGAPSGRAISLLGGEAFGVYKYTHNLPLALAFVEFASSPSQSVYYMSNDSLLPVRYSMFTVAAQQNLLPAQALNAFSSNYANSIQGSGNLPYWNSISAYFRTEVPSVVTGSASIQQATSIITSESVHAGATAYAS